MKIITYATHSDGTFDELVNNKFGFKIDVIGWGEKWVGYKGKCESIRKYLDTIDDNEIVVSLDGFDTKINKDPTLSENIFKKMKCGMLMSKDGYKGGEYITKCIFGTCKNNQTANAGMYMGYCWCIKQVLDNVLKYSCKDDQRNINTLCESYDYIKVDEDEKVFKNLLNTSSSHDSIFLGFPFELSFKRVYRGYVIEYPQFFINTITLVALGLMFMFPDMLVYIFILFMIYYIKMDHSCKI